MDGVGDPSNFNCSQYRKATDMVENKEYIHLGRKLENLGMVKGGPVKEIK